MFKMSEIRELIKLVDQSSIHELELENEGSRLTIRKANTIGPAASVHAPAHHAASMFASPAAHVSTVPAANPMPGIELADKQMEEDVHLHKIVSPMVGTFYRASAPGAAPFVNVGDKVEERSVVCIIEAMKLMNEIEAEVNGEVVEILVENGQLVEFGQPLFLIKV